MRLRIFFSKTDAMRYTSHLDLHRTWERTFRRAGLPLAYSQGYNPHPKINLASALPLGFTSSGEVLDVWLEHDLDVHEIKSTLERAVPPGISIISITEISPKLPSLQSELRSSEYLVNQFEVPNDLKSKVDTLFAAMSIPRQLRNKTYDLRPLVEVLEINDDHIGGSNLLIVLTAREGATGRPEEVLRVLEIDPQKAHIHRTRLIFQE